MLKAIVNSPVRSGDQTIVNGNLVIGTSGKGIDFSATSGTGTSELLADYEEGTWTPVGNNVTLAIANGKYVKVGRLVMLQGQIRLPVTADTSDLQITGLPFANGSGSPSAGSIGYISPATATGLNSNIDAGSSTLKFYGNVGESYPNNALWSNAFITFSICYQA